MFNKKLKNLFYYVPILKENLSRDDRKLYGKKRIGVFF